MAENTKNLNLKKPSQNDFYNVDDFNENFQKLDDFVGRKDNPHGVTAKQIGAVPVLNGLASGTDLNSVTTSGFYRINENPINAPSGTAYGQMIVVHGGNDTIAQMIFQHNSSRMYFRSGNPTEIGGSGTWKEWVEVYTSSQELAKIQTGSYVGNGNYGSSNANKLNFNFTPKLVLIVDPYYTPTSFIYGMTTCKPFTTTVGTTDSKVYIQWEDNAVKWWFLTNAEGQGNNTNKTYYWVAIG